MKPGDRVEYLIERKGTTATSQAYPATVVSLSASGRVNIRLDGAPARDVRAVKPSQVRPVLAQRRR